jgi:hypothetical protein
MGLVSKISDSLMRFTILSMAGRIEEEIGQLPVRRTEDGKRWVHAEIPAREKGKPIDLPVYGDAEHNLGISGLIH